MAYFRAGKISSGGILPRWVKTFHAVITVRLRTGHVLRCPTEGLKRIHRNPTANMRFWLLPVMHKRNLQALSWSHNKKVNQQAALKPLSQHRDTLSITAEK